MNLSIEIKETAVAKPEQVLFTDTGVTCRKKTYNWDEIDGIIHTVKDVKAVGLKSNRQFLIFLRSKNEPKKWMNLSTTTAFGVGNEKAEENFNQMRNILREKVTLPLLQDFEEKLKNGETIEIDKISAIQNGISFKLKKGLFSKAEQIELDWKQVEFIDNEMFPTTIKFKDRNDKKNGCFVAKNFWNVSILTEYISKKNSI